MTTVAATATVLPQVAKGEGSGVKKKKKRKSIEKKLPFLSTRFDTLVSFDIFDFVQFKTQMKIIKLKAQERREGVQDLTELIAQIPSSKKRKLKKSKNCASRINRKKILKREIKDSDIENFFKENTEVKSHKRARAYIKATEYIREYLKRHPKIPVEKSHKSMRASATTIAHAKVSNKSSFVIDSKPSVRRHDTNLTQRKEAVPMPNQVSMEPTPRGHVTDNVDHVAAINSWIQKNYSSLNTAQKQLVHMQLQYLNNLKKTSFQNQAFILSPQHLNNLNNVGFLHANFNPFNNNYTNFVRIPSYSVDAGQSNLQLITSLQQQQQQQQQQNSYRVQMPLSFLGDTKEGGSPRPHGNLNFGDPTE